MRNSELVLVLHGLGNSRSIMSSLCWYLRRRGFSVLNIGYPSCQYDSKDLVNYISNTLKSEYGKGIYHSVSLVGFSLGSQLARIIIDQNSDSINFSRLVMLAPPNQSSSIARFLRSYLPTSKIWGPVFDELCKHEFPNPCTKVEVGIIAGCIGFKCGFNPFFREDNDGLVTVRETILEGAKEHKQLLALHGTIPLQPRILRLTARFLEKGHF